MSLRFFSFGSSADIAVMLAIGSNPFFIKQNRGNDNNWSRSYIFS
jgi:hypothetical protein